MQHNLKKSSLKTPLILLILLFSFSLCGPSLAIKSSPSTEDEKRLEEIFAKISPQENLKDRVLLASEQFLGTPYGESEDLSKLDCTNFVEVVLAIAFTSGTNNLISSYQSMLKQIYYPGTEEGMVYYNHFPSRDWIPNLIRRKRATDVSHELICLKRDKEGKCIAKAPIDRKSWYEKSHPQHLETFLAAYPDERPSLVELPYISLTQLFKPTDQFLSENYKDAVRGLRESIAKQEDEDHREKFQEELNNLKRFHYKEETTLNSEMLEKIPNGSIIHVVNPHRQRVIELCGTDMIVSHVGIAVWKEEEQSRRLYLRHASSIFKQVVDEDFVEYFRKYLENETLKGFNTLECL